MILFLALFSCESTGVETVNVVSTNASRQASPALPAGSHVFTFVNQCSQALWIGSFGQNGQPSLDGGGWEMAAGVTRKIDVPLFNSGRVWPRTSCTFPVPGTTVNQCASGGCLDANGHFGLKCAQTGAPPAALVEWTLDAPSGNGPIDYYDASLVDGWAVTMQMVADAGTYNPTADPGMDPARWCAMGGCTIAPTCPAAYTSAGGDLCLSPCQANPTTKSCCTCSLSNPVTCPEAACAENYGCSPYSSPPNPADMTCDPWSKDPARAWDAAQQGYISAVHEACPSAYAWQFDDTQGTFNCRKTGGLVNYTITFCPPSATTP